MAKTKLLTNVTRTKSELNAAKARVKNLEKAHKAAVKAATKASKPKGGAGE